MIIPTVHLNGTSKEELSRQVGNAARAVDAARIALTDATPNGRDYYVQGQYALARALDEHLTRTQRLTDTYNELVALYEAIDAQGAAAPEMRDVLAAAIDVLDADGIVYGNSEHEPLDVLSKARALLARIDGE